MHFVLYCSCCEGRYSINIHLKCLENLGKVRVFDNDWRVATLEVLYMYLTGNATKINIETYAFLLHSTVQSM